MRELTAADYSWVNKEVSRFVASGALPAHECDDARQEGYLALLECAQRFNNGHFYGFAVLRVRGAMMDQMRRFGRYRGRGGHVFIHLEESPVLMRSFYGEA